jgi:hypothetical protein
MRTRHVLHDSDVDVKPCVLVLRFNLRDIALMVREPKHLASETRSVLLPPMLISGEYFSPLAGGRRNVRLLTRSLNPFRGADNSASVTY